MISGQFPVALAFCFCLAFCVGASVYDVNGPREIPYANLPYCRNVTASFEMCFGFFGNLVAFSNTITYSKQVWMGVGFHEVGSAYLGMQHGDFVVATFNNDGTIDDVVDMYCDCANETEPTEDTNADYGGEDNILEFGGSQKQQGDGQWVNHAYFSRYRNTGDQFDHSLGGGVQPLIWAHGTNNKFGYHQGNKGEFTWDLTDPYNY